MTLDFGERRDSWVCCQKPTSVRITPKEHPTHVMDHVISRAFVMLELSKVSDVTKHTKECFKFRITGSVNHFDRAGCKI